MKRKLFLSLLVLEALLCIAFCLTKEAPANAFTVAVAFPFAQAGIGLRALSLTGRLGNTAALVLYLALCLLPVGFLFSIMGRRKFRAEDALLALLSALLFAVLYLMVNPGKISAMFALPGESGLTMGKATLGIAVYSVLLGYVILRVLRLSFESGMDRLHRFLNALLMLINVLFVWAIFCVSFLDMLNAFASLRAANTGAEAALGMSYTFTVLKFITDSIPYALDIATVFIMMRLVHEMTADRYSEASVTAVSRLSRWCAKALAAIVLTNIAFNVLQLIFAGSLRNFNSTLNLPVISILFVLVALFLARISAENQAFKRDSDLII